MGKFINVNLDKNLTCFGTVLTARCPVYENQMLDVKMRVFIEWETLFVVRHATVIEKTLTLQKRMSL